MTKIFIFTFFFLIIFGCTINQSIAQTRNRIFATELTELKEYFHIPAISVIIKNGDKTIFEDYLGFVNLKTKIVNDSLTIFPMASLTKIFSAVLIMKLVEEKKLSLDEPIKKYVSIRDDINNCALSSREIYCEKTGGWDAKTRDQRCRLDAHSDTTRD